MGVFRGRVQGSEGASRCAEPRPADCVASVGKIRVGHTAGDNLAAGSKSKAAVISGITSSKLLKTAQGSVDETGVLTAVAALPVDRWRYKAETGLSQQVHIGPYAEDFKASFGVGDGVTINTTDALGVCLAAIKALAARVETLEADLREKSGEEK